MLVAVERRGQNRVLPLAREGRLGFGPSADSEPEGGLNDFTLAGHRNGSRHQPECGWNQTQTDRGATVTGAGDAGVYADQG